MGAYQSAFRLANTTVRGNGLTQVESGSFRGVNAHDAPTMPQKALSRKLANSQLAEK